MLDKIILEHPYIVGYCILNLLIFCYMRYVALGDLYRTNDNPEIRKKYDPFLRRDLDKIHIFWSFPWYCTYLPRLMIGWFILMFLSGGTTLIVYGQDCYKLGPIRYKIVRAWNMFWVRCLVILGGYPLIDRQYQYFDYSYYLGPDWKP